MKFVLLFVADEEAWMALAEGARGEAVQRIGEWYGKQVSAGRIVEGRRLRGRGSAVTVRLGPAGRSTRPKLVDGPFVESKESIGSYAVVEVADRDEAVELASGWPGGGSVEVRPLVEE